MPVPLSSPFGRTLWENLAERAWINLGNPKAASSTANPSQNDLEYDAFRHAFTSAQWARVSEVGARAGGDYIELSRLNRNSTEFHRRDMRGDLINNQKGREIGVNTPIHWTDQDVAKEVYDAIKRGDLVTDKQNDPKTLPGNFPPSLEPKTWIEIGTDILQPWLTRLWSGFSDATQVLDDYTFNVKKLISNVVGTTPDPLFKIIRYVDPLILDLDGDGLEITSLSHGILFDANGDTVKTGTAWVAADDGLLVWDRNSNGQIDSGRELFGDETLLVNGGRAAHGFAALSELDSNADGKFDVNDSQYENLRVWRDLNQDGISQSNELQTLVDAKVREIRISSTPTNQIFNDALLVQNGAFIRTDGSEGQVGSFVLAQNNSERSFVPIAVSEDAAALINIGGSGWVRDLQEAATQNPELINLYNQANTAITREEFSAAVARLLLEWGNTSAYESASKKALAAGFGLILSDPINNQERGWMDMAIKATIQEREEFRAPLSPGDRLSFDAMRERMVGQLEKTEAYEAFTGHTFLNWDQILGDAVNYVARVAVPSGGLPVEMWVSLSQLILENRNAVMSSEQGYIRVTVPVPVGAESSHIENLWDRIVDDAVSNLMGPLRLYKYVSMIDLTATEEGIALDFSRLDAAITAAETLSVQEGVALVFDLQETHGQLFAGMGYSVSGRIHDFVQRIGSDPDVRDAMIANGFNIISGSGDYLTAGRDIYQSSSLGNSFSAGHGNDVLSGMEGNDGLSGGTGDDLIFGGDGNDLLYGGDGNDTLIGGAGNDALYADLGQNTYIFGRGDGQDVINSVNNEDASKRNTILFKDNILPSDVSLRQIFYSNLSADYWSLEISIDGSTDKITIDKFGWGIGNFLDGGGGDTRNRYNPVQQMGFADGTVWGLDEILEKLFTGGDGDDSFKGTLHADKMSGGAGSDVLFGMHGNDLISGGLGDDSLYGEAGDDSIDGGGGNDILNGATGANTYHFGRGDGQDEIHSERSQSDVTGEAFNTLQFKEGVQPADIVLKQVFDPHPYTRGHLALEASIAGTTDKVTMTGFFYEDDPLSFYSSVQQIRFADGTVWSTSTILERIFGGTVGADSIVGTYAGNLISGKEGADELYGRDGNDTLNGGADNDTLYGETGDDILDGGSGNDTLIGGAGDNTYLFGRGDGQDLVLYDETNYEPQGRFNTLQFKAGVAPSDLVLEQGGSNSQLKVSIAGTTDSIAIDAFFFQDNPSSTRNGIQQFRFDDGTVWSIATILENLFQGSGAADSIVGTIGNDVITGQGDADVLFGRGGNDEIHGGDGDDDLRGEDGNDTLDGGAGNDKLEGGFGYDTFLFGKGDGRDLISRGVYNPSAEFGTLQFKAGVTQNEILLKRVSNSAQGIEQGLEVSFAGATDAITINYFFYGDDPTNLDNGVRLFKFADGSSWDLSAILTRMYTGTAAADTLVGTVAADTISGGAGADNLAGRAGNDTLIGEADNDILSGEIGDDMLYGGIGDDRLDGGLGVDAMFGGSGNDTYIVDNIADVVIENANEGTDLVQSSVAYALSDYVENLTLTGSAGNGGVGNAMNNVLTGNSAANTLTGMDGNDTLNGLGGADTLVGGKGDDTYVVDNIADVVTESSGEGVDLVQSSVTFTLSPNAENLTLTGSSSLNGTGNALNNVLTGNSASNTLNGMDGNDTLNGGAGIDTMLGGAGDDTYVVDNTADVVTEGVSAGIDLVQSSVTYTLVTNVENLNLTGSSAINGTGNALANVLIGNSAANILNGSAGADTLAGGVGNDTYIVDDISDVVTELANEGTDLVQSSVSFTLAVNVENLTLTGSAGVNGTGNAGANVVTGNSGDNVIDGGAGADTMAGGLGNDTYSVDSAGDVVTEGSSAGTDLVHSSINYTLGANVENLTLTGGSAINATGNTLANILTGNSAANVLNGAAGADTLAGGSGDDTYIVDNTADVVIEGVDDGVDLVQSSVSYTLAANVEHLTLSGTGSINGTGNASNNTLTGNSGANLLNGGIGADTMVGGSGNDTYVVDDTADAVIEAAGAGTDIVQSTASYTLADNVENLTLTGSGATSGTGNASANVLTGNSAANVLDGGAGADSMAGGAGDDVYVVDNAGDVVTEAASSGVDSVRSNIVYTLGTNVENLTLTGSAGINGTGNSLGNILSGNSGANSLSGLAGDDTLDGAAGNDSLIGGAGSDTYLFGRGDGQDSLVENDATAGNQDRLVFKSGVAVTDVSAVREGDALVLKIGGSADQVRVNGYFSNNGVNSAMVEEVRFTDSPMTVWNYAYISGLVLNSAPTLDSPLADQSGTADAPFVWTVPSITFSDPDAGAVLSYSAQLEDGTFLPFWLTFNSETQQFTGSPGATDIGTLQVKVVVRDQFGMHASAVFALTIESGQVADIRGSEGPDTLTGTEGNDFIFGEEGLDTLHGGSGNDTLDGGSGADAMSGGAGDDLYIVDNVSDSVIENPTEGNDLVESGVTYTLAANIENLTLTGTEAINGTGNTLSNTLVGNSAANLLNGGAGADTMSGGLGDDSYVVDNTGDVVTEDVDGGTDLVQSGVTRTLGGNQENLTLTGASVINGTGNSLANVMTGNGAANTLTGWGSNDILIGGKGTDLLVGGDGHDVYVLRRGDGVDTITESGSTATNLDSSQFGEDIAADQLWFRQVGSNLEVSVMGTGDRFSIYNWYAGSQYRVERFESGDGQLLLSGQVQNLVQAMASFSPPAAGQTTMPPEYAATLAPVIAANWQ